MSPALIRALIEIGANTAAGFLNPGSTAGIVIKIGTNIADRVLLSLNAQLAGKSLDQLTDAEMLQAVQLLKIKTPDELFDEGFEKGIES